jgi:hypothetical protein
MPGTLARAAEPSGSALKRAGRDDSGSPAPVAAAGMSLAAQLAWTLETTHDLSAWSKSNQGQQLTNCAVNRNSDSTTSKPRYTSETSGDA